MKLGEIAGILGSLADGLPNDLSEQEPIGYSIDSRSVRAGELFFAIRGEKHDGHRFVDDAMGRGALAAVVSHDWSGVAGINRAGLLPVADTLRALQSLASATLESWGGRLIAITGSMGKTTTKEITADVLSRVYRVARTIGNLNNAYGLPLSILRMESDGSRASDFDCAVLEMGMNHRGELAELTRIAPPDVAVVTNAAPVHLEFFSSVDEIAEAKSELVSGVKPGGTAVLNADDARVAQMRNVRSDVEFRTFGIERTADVMAQDIRPGGLALTRFQLVTPRGMIETSLRLGGRHNLYNALAAAAVADSCEVSLEQIGDALTNFSSLKMRGEIREFREGFTVIDDSYNSNPQALMEMVTTLCEAEGYKRRIVVAGEMLELGSTGPRLHREAGRSIASHAVDLLIGVRGLARELVEAARQSGLSPESAVFCETPDEAGEILKQAARAGDLILIKGSRGVRTDIVVERLRQPIED
jgi:UDP-N-acetylmuramoyl-tripeptide--D-alanyl-D-alanine ligase